MSIRLTPEVHKETYDKIFAKVKAKGLSDRDADIITTGKIYQRSMTCMANKYGITLKEVEEVFKNYYSH